MASPENVRAREIQEALLVALGGNPEATIDNLRAGFEQWSAQYLPPPPELVTEPVDADGVPAVWAYLPNTSSARTVFHLHGGGFSLGTPTSYRGLAAGLSRAADARVLLVDYRLAPEHPYPAGPQDAATAYRWLVKNEADPARTVVSGDSAGGAVAVDLLVELRENGDRLPAAAVCLSGFFDLTLSGESMDRLADRDPMVKRPMAANMAAGYLMGQDAKAASPLFADLTGLPPMLLLAGTWEALMDDTTRLAERARAAGVDVTVELGEQMYHVWPAMWSFLPEARAAMELIGRFVRERTG